MKKQLVYYILIIFVTENLPKVLGNLEMDIAKKISEQNSTVLSRKRRYLIFPEGSSFQVVFDLTYPSVGMGNAFVFGNTAAMGWELPSTPIFLDKKKMSEEEDEKKENKTMEKVPEHLDHSEDYQDWHSWHPPATLNDIHEDYADWQHTNDFTPNSDGSYESAAWSNIDRSPVTFYSNPFETYISQNLPKKIVPVNRQFLKYYGNSYENEPDFWNLRRNFQHNSKLARQRPIPTASLQNVMVPLRKTVTHHIHRRSRRELYTKIEKLLTALSKDGKACILKAICQVNKIPKNKGSMWEEILKAIFKVKPHNLYPDEDHYDKAANPVHDCDKMYPECDGHVLGKIFKNKLGK